MIVKFDFNKNTNKCHIAISDADIIDRIRQAFSVKNEGKKFVASHKKQWVDDRIYFINPTGSFHFGITDLILRWLKKFVFDRTVEYRFSNEFKERFKVDNDSDIIDNLSFNMYDYQLKSVRLALKYKFGLFILGTGAGKTFTIASLLNNLYDKKKVKRTLILVPDTGLVLQFQEELQNIYKMKQKIGVFYDKINKINEEDEIIIANRQLFLSRFSQNLKLFTDKIDCLIVDEAHSMKANNEVSKKVNMIRSEYKFGFTGTLPENKVDQMKVIGILGPIRYIKSSNELRKEGFLSNVNVRQIEIKYEKLSLDRNHNWEDELTFLKTYEPRLNLLCGLMLKMPKNVLILVNRIDHGNALLELINKIDKNKTKKKYFIQGSTEQSERENIKKIMEVDDNVVCIAMSKIFSTGINIKNLHHIILAEGGKSSVTVVQSIGRGLRLHPDKKMLTIFDINDKIKYSERHALRRLEIYNQEKIEVSKEIIKLSDDFKIN